MSKVKRGRLIGKKISYASTDRIEGLQQTAHEFMLEVFELLPGDCLITDESSLRDFADFGSFETSQIWSRITHLYAFGRADVPSEILVNIFAEIQARKPCIEGP